MENAEHERLQTDLFDEYQRALFVNRDAAPPAELDSHYVMVAKLLERQLGPVQSDSLPPSMTFVTTLRQRIENEATRATPRANNVIQSRTERKRRSRGRHQRRLLAWRWMSVAAVLTLVILGTALWVTQPDETSAREIVEQANSPSLSTIQSFVMTETRTLTFDGIERHAQARRWYESPHRWRAETEEIVITPTGTRTLHYGTVGDGESVWRWNDDSAQVQEFVSDQWDLVGAILFGDGRSGLDSALQASNECVDPERLDDDIVAGHAAFVIDLGPSLCPSASAPETNGRRMIWVDKETFFILKEMQYDGRPGHEGELLSTAEVTSIQYNVPIMPRVFTFTPDMPVEDRSKPEKRPQPAPTATAANQDQSLVELREQAEYPIFAPTYLPEGATFESVTNISESPDKPMLLITYRVSGGSEITVLNGPPGCCLSYKEGHPIMLPNGILAHFISGQPASGTGILRWEQDGTYISIGNLELDLSQDELLRIAVSMSKTEEPILTE